MPDLVDDLRRLAGPDRPPTDHARALALTRLREEIDRERAAGRAAPVRSRRRRPAIAAAVATTAALLAAGAALVPSRGPGARAILERAAAAVSPDETEILTADVHGWQLEGASPAPVADYGTVRVWARRVPGAGTREFRSLTLASASEPGGGRQRGDETASAPAAGAPVDASAASFTTEDYDATHDRLTVTPGMKSEVTPELFEARALLARARAGTAVHVADAVVGGRAAYALTWREDTSRLPNPISVEMTLWIDRETYAPLQFADHDQGIGAAGRPVDQTYKASIAGFRRLSDTPANRALLRMGPHPDAQRVTARP